ncbi:triphosphoribosyl-dephospho-CoA synthase [Thalassoglobus neptunius]|uniref:Triphosphoribosyl-dephospho-CoA synthase n=1 Tax=Thalassoglobus neptunius TaxID=1938619 RepID=A0A5C5X310_9PLAN|nr:triphosphoribosyl-dephospho-CoA synthase [Thalassoglobus neptunius]TWT57346.1 triphosphoribosyl-dephospho-CoA synthase [Thalassoglobus neptunius]
MSRRLNLAIDTKSSQITTACLLEAAARKPGNVHPQAQFDDLTFSNFETAAQITGQILGDEQRSLSVAAQILSVVRKTREQVQSNVNLGILLLLAPMAAVENHLSLEEGIHDVLAALDPREASIVYQAIRESQPGGMGTSQQQDVTSEPTQPLVACMQFAAAKDTIARQYTTDFSLILGQGRELFCQWWERTLDWEVSVIGTQLELMHRVPDTLIIRKCGRETGEISALKAAEVLEKGWPDTQQGKIALSEFDQWLRADGHRRNPGTTADLIAAILYGAIRDGHWGPPSQIMISET